MEASLNGHSKREKGKDIIFFFFFALFKKGAINTLIHKHYEFRGEEESVFPFPTIFFL